MPKHSTLKHPKITKDIYKHKEAFRFITYKGKTKSLTVWNSRDGAVPVIIYSIDGKEQLTQTVDIGDRVVNYKLKDGDYYFADTTKKRAKFLAKKIVRGRWENKKYPLYQKYGSKAEAIRLIYKSFYADGKAFTLLKHGKDETTYMTRRFRNFINGA